MCGKRAAHTLLNAAQPCRRNMPGGMSETFFVARHSAFRPFSGRRAAENPEKRRKRAAFSPSAAAVGKSFGKGGIRQKKSFFCGAGTFSGSFSAEPADRKQCRCRFCAARREELGPAAGLSAAGNNNEMNNFLLCTLHKAMNNFYLKCSLIFL
jgi:hypothetical protein